MQEIWKDVNGYEGLYQVSNLGRVRSLERKATDGRQINERILKPAFDVGKYLTVALHKNKKQKTHKVHRLVAFAFIKNPNNKPHVNHIDGNKSNNRVDNLEWCTQLENNRHSFHELKRGSWRIGLRIRPTNAKEVLQFNKETNQLIKTYPSIMEAGRETGIQFKNIHKVCCGGRKTAGGYAWKYAEDCLC